MKKLLRSPMCRKETVADVSFGWKPDVHDLDNGVIQPSFEKPMPVPLSSCWQMILRNLMRKLKCGEPFDIEYEEIRRSSLWLALTRELLHARSSVGE